MVGIVLETLLEDPLALGLDAAELKRIARAAANAGFRTASLAEPNATSVGPAEARAILDDAGLSIEIAEILAPWQDGPAAVLENIERELDVLDTLGAGLTLAAHMPRPSLDMPRATEGFAVLCERAAKREIRVVLEGIPSFMPVDLAMAWSIVRESGARNAGIDVDMMHWHYQRGGPDFALLRSIPGDSIYYVQICDAAPGETPADEDYIRVAVSERPLPGDGAVDIGAVLKTLTDIGAKPFYAMEVYNAGLRKQGPDAMARKIYEAGGRLFAHA